ncbi:hypothetical protein NPIL_373841 [Nephila pilipes]|uniref:Uncharacterized protein n=1 Tax=Nephila pilipes TaxID=299642 RepID=A0A8X6NZF3_NEPPI|nr:hypothetical protein NPIL_373841 [Nephila pilipes]
MVPFTRISRLRPPRNVVPEGFIILLMGYVTLECSFLHTLLLPFCSRREKTLRMEHYEHGWERKVAMSIPPTGPIVDSEIGRKGLKEWNKKNGAAYRVVVCAQHALVDYCKPGLKRGRPRT